jgi:hypothetical protein
MQSQFIISLSWKFRFMFGSLSSVSNGSFFGGEEEEGERLVGWSGGGVVGVIWE